MLSPNHPSSEIFKIILVFLLLESLIQFFFIYKSNYIAQLVIKDILKVRHKRGVLYFDNYSNIKIGIYKIGCL